MTQEEKARELAIKLTRDIDDKGNEVYNVSVETALQEMAAWKEQQMIDNAVDATIFSELKGSDGSLFQAKSDMFRMNGVKISDRIKVIPIKIE